MYPFLSNPKTRFNSSDLKRAFTRVIYIHIMELFDHSK